jgi:REP element-mobilizing transposase RayT
MNTAAYYPEKPPRGWHGRGYLPHFDGGEGHPQAVTFRLADSMPEAVVAAWLEELKCRPTAERDTELRKRMEVYLDAGHGACHLRNPRIGLLVESAFLFFDGLRYHLHAWVVMPNHVHLLFTPAVGRSLSELVKAWKSFTSKEANRILGRGGQFWQADYFDRFIRDEEHFARATEYIENNPVKAGLCARPEDWPWSSARFRMCANQRADGTSALPGSGPADGTSALPGSGPADGTSALPGKTFPGSADVPSALADQRSALPGKIT